MQVLLINQNATIERLVKLSSGKLGYELVNAKDISEVENEAYGFIIIDSDLYNEEEFGVLKQKFGSAKYILIITKGADRPDGFDVYVEKPFLPTELVDIFSSLATSVADTNDDAVFGDDMSAFGNDESELGTLDEDAVFGIGGEENSADELGELGDLDDFGSMELDEEKTTEPTVDGLDDLELSFDEAEETQSKEDEIGDLDLDGKEESLAEEDDFQINLDEQMSAIGNEVDGIEFDAPEDISLDEPSDELSLDSIEGNDAFGSMEELGMDNIEADDNLLMEEDNQADFGSVALEDDDMGELSFDEDIAQADEAPSMESDAHIFDEDEVNKLKDLLDETEEEKSESDDFDLENIKIHNEELGSLTEESLAEALGVNIENEAQDIDDMPSELDTSSDISGSDIPDSLPVAPVVSAAAATNIPANAIQLNPNQSITISLDALKELLNMADVTINITLSKKQ